MCDTHDRSFSSHLAVKDGRDFETRHPFPQRTSLEGLESELFQLVSSNATPEQWAKWLWTSPLEHAAARGNLKPVDNLLL